MKREFIYIAEDGTKFENEQSCLNYENILTNLAIYKLTFRNKKEIMILLPKTVSTEIIYMLFGYNKDFNGYIYQINNASLSDLNNMNKSYVLVLEGTESLSDEKYENLQMFSDKKDYYFFDAEDCKDWLNENLGYFNDTLDYRFNFNGYYFD